MGRAEVLCRCSMMAVLFAGSQLRAEVIIIANASVKTAKASNADIREAFIGATSSLRDGSRVAPVLLKPGQVHEEFLSEFVGKGDIAFRATWRSLVFSGQGTMPRSIDTEAGMVEYVAKTPGAIGYVAKGTPHPGVKVLAIE